MPFISSEQTQLLKTRLVSKIGPADGGAAAECIAKAVCDWFEQDVLPKLDVQTGIALGVGGHPLGGPAVGATTALGEIK